MFCKISSSTKIKYITIYVIGVVIKKNQLKKALNLEEEMLNHFLWFNFLIQQLFSLLNLFCFTSLHLAISFLCFLVYKQHFLFTHRALFWRIHFKCENHLKKRFINGIYNYLWLSIVLPTLSTETSICKAA